MRFLPETGIEFIKFLPEGRMHEVSTGNRNGENMRFLPEEERESMRLRFLQEKGRESV